MSYFRKSPIALLAIAAIAAIFTSCSTSSPLSTGTSSFSTSPALPPLKAPPDIFSKYSKDAKSSMAKGWTRGMDMSGVSWNDKRTATLITPRHVVMAKHYSRGPLEPVIFHDRSGKRIVRKLIGFQPASGDIKVGLLDEPVPSNYTPYPLLASSTDPKSLIGRRVIVTDQTKKLFVHKIKSIDNSKINFEQDKEDLYGWGKKLIAGDSGNPSFIISGNKLLLIETHTTGGPGAGPYYGSENAQGSIRRAVEILDSSYKIRTAPLR